MEIYYLKKEEFLNAVNLESLEKFKDNREYKCHDKYLEHLCGLFLTKFVAKNIYGLTNTDIELNNNKPYFSSHKINFSISHSKNIVLAAFNSKNIGIDIEYMYPRNYQKIMSRYNKNIKNLTRQDFYRFWTVHEAEIKLGTEPKSIYSAFLNEDYVFSCVSEDTILSNLRLIEISCIDKNIDLIKEYETPKSLIIS